MNCFCQIGFVFLKAFVINEFTGETFECSGGATSQCLQSKDDILENMSFDKQNLPQSILGLAIMFLFFLACALIALERDRLVFLPLGHIGLKQRDRNDNPDSKNDRKDYALVTTSEPELQGPIETPTPTLIEGLQ